MEPIKDAFHRLSRFGGAAKERALPVWKSAQLQSEPGLQWLRARPRVAFWASGIGIALAFLAFSGATAAGAALLAWAALRQAQTASERHQEQTNADRQRRITEGFSKAVEQLGSDKLEVRLGGIYSLERISKESPADYWTVMENLSAFVRERSRRNEAERNSQDLEQRISRRAYFLWQDAGRPDGEAEDFWAVAAREEELGDPAADIAAVLTVIKRRSEQSREREGASDWRFDLSGAILKRYDLNGTHLARVSLNGAHLEEAILRDTHLEGAHLWLAHLDGANLSGAHLERADLNSAYLEWANLSGTYLGGAGLRDAHLERAFLPGAHLEGADLWVAHLDGAILSDTHLDGADLRDAHLEGADLSGAHLEGAFLEGAELNGAHLEGAILRDTHLEGADLSGAVGLSAPQLHGAHGDAATILPEGLARPAHWPSARVTAGQEPPPTPEA